MKTNKLIKIKRCILSFLFVASFGGSLLAITTPQLAFAADNTCGGNFLGFPPWYRNLTTAPPECDIRSPGNADDLRDFILTIGINVVEMGIVLVAYLSGFFFLYGGFLFIFSQGKPESIVKGKSTMTMALIGLVLSIAAVSFIEFIWGKF